MVLLDLGSGWVTPSWLPLALAGVLLVVIGFLYWSMRRNINRIEVPPATSPVSPGADDREPSEP